jgi:hypothetical protein
MYAFLKFMLVFCPSLCRSACECFSTVLTFESALALNNKLIDNFLRFPESLGSPFFDACNFSYD